MALHETIVVRSDAEVKQTPDFIVATGDRILRTHLADQAKAFPTYRGKRFHYVGMVPSLDVDGVSLVAHAEWFFIDIYDSCGYRIAKDHIAVASEIFYDSDELIGLLDELRARREGRARA